MPHRHQLPHNQILLTKPLLPPPQSLHLLPTQVFQLIQRSLQILRQHIHIKRPTRKTATCVAAREVGVGSSRAVEVATWCDVKDAAADGEVDGGVVLAVVGEEGGWGEGFEDGGGWWGREGGGEGWGGPEAVVDQEGEEGEEDEVDGCCDGGAGCWIREKVGRFEVGKRTLAPLVERRRRSVSMLEDVSFSVLYMEGVLGFVLSSMSAQVDLETLKHLMDKVGLTCEQ